MFEVYPCVRVAPDQDSEEQGADAGRDKHHEQPEQALVTGGNKGVIVESEGEDSLTFHRKIVSSVTCRAGHT